MDKTLKCYKRGLLISLILLTACITFILSDAYNSRRYVFIDGGAHKGETIKHFVKSGRYAQSPWEMVSFEANPYLIETIPTRDDLTVLNKAIWIEDGEISFRISEKTIASSLIEFSWEEEEDNRVTVPSVNFGNWLKQHVTVEDFVLVKLDIEEAEYEVLDRMLKDGSIHHIDELFVEFHRQRKPENKKQKRYILRELRKLGIPVKHMNSKDGRWF